MNSEALISLKRLFQQEAGFYNNTHKPTDINVIQEKTRYKHVIQ